MDLEDKLNAMETETFEDPVHMLKTKSNLSAINAPIVGGASTSIGSISLEDLELLKMIKSRGIKNKDDLENADNKMNTLKGKRRLPTKSIGDPKKVKGMIINFNDMLDQVFWLYRNPESDYDDIPQANILSRQDWHSIDDVAKFTKVLDHYFEVVEEKQFKYNFSRDGFKVFLMYQDQAFDPSILRLANTTEVKVAKDVKEKPVLLFSEILSKPFKSDYKVQPNIEIAITRIHTNKIRLDSKPVDMLIEIAPNYADYCEVVAENSADGSRKISFIGKHEYIWITKGLAVSVCPSTYKCLSQSTNRVLENTFNSRMLNLINVDDWMMVEVIAAPKVLIVDVVAGNITMGESKFVGDSFGATINGEAANLEARRDWFANNFQGIWELSGLNNDPNVYQYLIKDDLDVRTKIVQCKKVGVLCGYSQNKLLVAYNTPSGLGNLVQIDASALTVLKESKREIAANDQKNTIILNGVSMNVNNNYPNYVLFKEGTKIYVSDSKFAGYAQDDEEISTTICRTSKDTTMKIDEESIKTMNEDQITKILTKMMKLPEVRDRFLNMYNRN